MRRKVLSKYFISYILVLLIPLIIGGILYIKINQVVKEEVTRSNMYILSDFSLNMDKKLESIKRMALEISTNKNMGKFLQDNYSNANNNLYYVAELIEEISHYLAVNNFASDYYIYFHRNNFILTSNSKYDAKFFYDKIYNYNNYAFEEWVRILKEEPYSKFLDGYTYDLSKMSKSNKNIGYLFQKSFYGNKLDASIVVLFDENFVEQTLRGLNISGEAYVLDENNKIIMSSNSHKNFSLENINFKEDCPQDIKIGNKDFVIMNVCSKVSTWKYVFLIPKDVFMKRSYYVHNIALTISLLYAIIGIMIAIFMAHKNYNPIQKLIEITSNLNKENKIVKNEFDYIEKTIFKIAKEKENVKQDLIKQVPLLKSTLLYKMLKGELHDINISYKVMKEYGINFETENFAVILFSIEHSDKFNKNNMEDWLMAKYVTENIIQEVLNKDNICYFVETENEVIAAIVNFKSYEKEEVWYDELKRGIEQSKNYLENYFGVFFKSYISSIDSGMYKVSNLYKEALMTMDYSRIYDKDLIVFYSKINFDYQYYSYSPDVEKSIVNFIKTGDYKTVEELLNNVIDENIVVRKINLKLFRYLTYDLINTAIKTSSELGIDEIFNEEFNNLDNLKNFNTIVEFKLQIKKIYKKLCEYINNNKKNHDEFMKEQIINYIKVHYNDKNFSQVVMAEHIKVTSAYLSYFFKINFGEHMVDFINKYKIEKVKELITSEENLPLAEIADMTGFNSDTSLIKTFKKYEGITPGKYRNVMHK